MKYKIGDTDPPLFRDAGSGVWGSKRPTLEARAAKFAITSSLAHMASILGRHAYLHLHHYFSNTGKELTIDVRSMLLLPDQRIAFDYEVYLAREFAETLAPGEWKIASGDVCAVGNTKEESKDWYYAVGAYQAWGMATVTVPPVNPKPRMFSMEFEYKVFDQYNWNKDAQVTIGGVVVTDAFMGDFHRMGLAREYEMRASCFVSVDWEQGKPPVISPIGALELAGVGQPLLRPVITF